MAEPSADAAQLRRQAEKIACKNKAQPPENLEAMTPEETRQTLHELRVHQIEFEMQNEELRQAKAALEDSNAQYFDLYDLAPLGYCTLSEKGIIMMVNLMTCSLLGVDRSKLIRHPFSPFILAEDYNIYYPHMRKLFETGEPQTFELRMHGQNGTLFWAQIVITAVQEAGGIPVCRAVIANITERKQAEKELIAKNAELERFSYSMSHDLRSPLVTIQTFLGHLVQDMAGGGTDRVAQDLAFIRSAAEKMNSLLDELLKFLKVGHMTNPSVETPLQEIAQEAIGLVAGCIYKRGVRVQVTQEPVLLYGDRVRLVEVFQNLIDNAVKFMGGQPEPLIEIVAETKNGEIVFFVRDNGMGIDPKYKYKLFGLFEKLNPKMEGTGMGLALVKRIVEMHGGRIWAESEGLGKGACFWFTLLLKSSES